MSWLSTPKMARSRITRNPVTRGLAMLLLALVATTAAASQDDIQFKIDTWQDRAIDFATLRVFALTPMPPGTANRIARGIRTREDDIRAALIAGFEERGYVQDTNADPSASVDFTLHFMFTPPERQQQSRTSRTIGQIQGSVEIQTGGDTFNHLYVELRHPETNMPIWRGRANRVLKRKSKDELRRLQAACQSIAKAFPAAHTDSSESTTNR